MRALALETVVKWIILGAVALIVINLVLFFSEEIKNLVRGTIQPKKSFKTEIIEAEKFSTSQIKVYLRACWDRTGEKFEEDVVCFILKGDMSEVDSSSLEDALEDPASVDISEFDNSKNIAVIRFKSLGNKVVLES